MSAVIAQPPRMSVEEFLDWSGGRDGKFEIDDGVVIAVASERTYVLGRKRRFARRSFGRWQRPLCHVRPSWKVRA